MNYTGLIERLSKQLDPLIVLSGILVIISNLFVVLSSVILVKKGQEPRCMYLLLGSISLSDFFIGGLPTVGYFVRPWIESNIWLCIAPLGMYTSCTLTSIVSVLLIAIDRYIYIVHGLQYRRLVYPKIVKYLILGSWIFGLVFGVVPLLKWRKPKEEIKICWYPLVATPSLIIITTLLGLLVVIIVIILYTHILYVAIMKVIQIGQMMKNNANQTNTTGLRFFIGSRKPPDLERDTCTAEPNAKNRVIKRDVSGQPPPPPNKWKAVKVVVFVTGSFALTSFPYLLTSIMLSLCDFKTDPQGCENFGITVVSPMGLIVRINSIMNPIIYAWWHTGYRKAFIKLFLRKSDTSY